jgi:hypothetical protein
MTQHDMKSKTVPIHVRVPEEIRTILEDAARKDHRNLSSLINKVLADYIENAGLMPKTGAGGKAPC